MARALTAYKKACDGGNQPSCYRYGRHQRQGQYVTRDLAQGVQRLTRPATRRVGDACCELGVMFENGRGRPARPAARVRALQAGLRGGPGAGLRQGQMALIDRLGHVHVYVHVHVNVHVPEPI